MAPRIPEDNRFQPETGCRTRARLVTAAITLSVLVLVGGCQSPVSGPIDQATSLDLRNHLVGTWIRPINDQPDRFEGIRFDDDGRFGLIGIHTMNGLTWQIDDHDLVLTTNTSRYVDPFETRLSIKTLTETTLVLEGDEGYFRSAWRRDDTAAGRISGEVTYRERIALPPGAAIHLTLEDVTRQDAPASFVAGQVIPVQNRQVPIPFALYYAAADIDPGRTYHLRADIVIDGRRRFQTREAHPVLTRGAPDHLEVRVEGIGKKAPAPGQSLARTIRVEDLALPATYTGQLQNASGRPDLITLNLYGNRMFLLRRQAESPAADDAPAFTDLGRWYLAHGGRQLVLIGRSEAPHKLAVKDPAQLRLLRLQGHGARLQQPVALKRTEELDPFDNALPLIGHFRYMADAALFVECLTETSFPVAQENDYLALERAYLDQVQTPGEPLYAELAGHFGQRPRMEGDGMEIVLVVDRFETVKRSSACQVHTALADLENTYWKLIELFGRTIVFNGTGQGEPHLILRPPERQMMGFSGCNGFFGLYRKDTKRLSFEDTGATMRACPLNPDLEQTFFKALNVTDRYKIFGEMLELYQGHNVVARFEAVYF